MGSSDHFYSRWTRTKRISSLVINERTPSHEIILYLRADKVIYSGLLLLYEPQHYDSGWCIYFTVARALMETIHCRPPSLKPRVMVSS